MLGWATKSIQGGNDTVCPCGVDDDITCESGSDLADSEHGYDKIPGGGSDYIWGGLGPDSLAGQDGNGIDANTSCTTSIAAGATG